MKNLANPQIYWLTPFIQAGGAATLELHYSVDDNKRQTIPSNMFFQKEWGDWKKGVLSLIQKVFFLLQFRRVKKNEKDYFATKARRHKVY